MSGIPPPKPPGLLNLGPNSGSKDPKKKGPDSSSTGGTTGSPSGLRGEVLTYAPAPSLPPAPSTPAPFAPAPGLPPPDNSVGGEQQQQDSLGLQSPPEFDAEALDNATGNSCLICDDPREFAHVEGMRMKSMATFIRSYGTTVAFALPTSVAWSHKQVEQLLAMARFGVIYDLHPKAMFMIIAGAGKLVQSFPITMQRTVQEEFVRVITNAYSANESTYFMVTGAQMKALAYLYVQACAKPVSPKTSTPSASTLPPLPTSTMATASVPVTVPVPVPVAIPVFTQDARQQQHQHPQYQPYVPPALAPASQVPVTPVGELG